MESDHGSVKKTMIEDAYDREGKKMLYLFDYGDEWHFVTELIEINEEPSHGDEIVVVEETGTPPNQYRHME